MPKNTFYVVDYLLKPEYSGDSFKDALKVFESSLRKYIRQIEADTIFTYNGMHALACSRLGFERPLNPRLIIDKRGSILIPQRG